VSFAETFHETSPRYSFEPSQVDLERLADLPWAPKFFKLSGESDSQCTPEYTVDVAKTNFDILHGLI